MNSKSRSNQKTKHSVKWEDDYESDAQSQEMRDNEYFSDDASSNEYDLSNEPNDSSFHKKQSQAFKFGAILESEKDKNEKKSKILKKKPDKMVYFNKEQEFEMFRESLLWIAIALSKQVELIAEEFKEDSNQLILSNYNKKLKNDNKMHDTFFQDEIATFAKMLPKLKKRKKAQILFRFISTLGLHFLFMSMDKSPIRTNIEDYERIELLLEIDMDSIIQDELDVTSFDYFKAMWFICLLGMNLNIPEERIMKKKNNSLNVSNDQTLQKKRQNYNEFIIPAFILLSEIIPLKAVDFDIVYLYKDEIKDYKLKTMDIQQAIPIRIEIQYTRDSIDTILLPVPLILQFQFLLQWRIGLLLKSTPPKLTRRDYIERNSKNNLSQTSVDIGTPSTPLSHLHSQSHQQQLQKQQQQLNTSSSSPIDFYQDSQTNVNADIQKMSDDIDSIKVDIINSKENVLGNVEEIFSKQLLELPSLEAIPEKEKNILDNLFTLLNDLSTKSGISYFYHWNKAIYLEKQSRDDNAFVSYILCAENSLLGSKLKPISLYRASVLCVSISSNSQIQELLTNQSGEISLRQRLACLTLVDKAHDLMTLALQSEDTTIVNNIQTLDQIMNSRDCSMRVWNPYMKLQSTPNKKILTNNLRALTNINENNQSTTNYSTNSTNLNNSRNSGNSNYSNYSNSQQMLHQRKKTIVKNITNSVSSILPKKNEYILEEKENQSLLTLLKKLIRNYWYWIILISSLLFLVRILIN